MYLFAKITVWISALYVSAAGLVTFLIDPIQLALFPELPHLVSLIYIPSGIRIFATVLFGTRAVPGVFLGTALAAHFIAGIENGLLLISLSIVSAVVAPIVFYSLKSIGIDAYYLALEEKPPKREGLLLAGFLTSALNGFSLAAVLEHFIGSAGSILIMAAIIVGDFVGFLVVIVLAKLTARSVGTKN